MEFTFDLSQTPVIGRRLLVKQEDGGLAPKPVASPRRSCSLSPADTSPLSGWKRPWMSQVLHSLYTYFFKVSLLFTKGRNILCGIDELVV